MNTEDADVELLSRAILNEAQAESQELQADAHSKAETIRQHATAEADGVRKSILEQAQREAERLRSQTIATAQLKARSMELEHREKLLETVFETASRQLRSIPGRSDYDKIVQGLLREAVKQLNAPEVEILADQDSRKLLGEQTLAQIAQDVHVRLTLGKPLEDRTGIIVQSPDGHLQYDNTLETRLNRLRSTLRAPVYGILTGASR